jgi:hypothetical protein
MVVNDAGAAEGGIDLDQYCRAIESHLCRKNDGHLIRIAGPTFDLVRGWAEQGVPLKVALTGIDRTFERYYRKGARRRPLQVSFCEADVLDVFDDWRRALGLFGAGRSGGGAPSAENGVPPAECEAGTSERAGTAECGAAGTAERGAGTSVPAGALAERPHRAASLPAHLERVANRLTLLRGDPRNDEEMETALAAAVLQMDAHRQVSRGVRGPARAALIAHLESLDDNLLARVRARLSPEQLDELRREAAETLAPFRERMPRVAYEAAHEAALTRLVREHAGLPVIRYDAGSDRSL